MKLQEYLKELIREDNQTIIQQFCDKYNKLDLEIDLEYPEFLIANYWNYSSSGKTYFEMCGPRISKEKAMQMAAHYNWPKMDGTFGTISCYNSFVHQPNNYSVFKLNGAIGLNGTTWTQIPKAYVLDAVLDLILEYPEFEFAVFFANRHQERTVQQEKENVSEFTTRIADVKYGFQYDPKNKKLKALKRRSAWQAVKQYQSQYTKEERKLFFPWESANYYANDVKGKAELAEFIEFEKRNAQKPNELEAIVTLRDYVEKIAEPQIFDSDFDGDAYLRAIAQDFDLMVYVEDRTFLEFMRMRDIIGDRPYFEMYGPKIPPQKAMELACDYQLNTEQNDTFGVLSCYDNPDHIPNNYGVFQLDGNIGLNGICEKFETKKELISNVLEMIIHDPEFEFAVAFSHWEESPPAKYAARAAHRADIMQTTFDYNLQPCDVEFGLSYDPAKRLFKVLGPQSIWEELKRYKALYTEEEQRRFDPDVSSLYYQSDPKGKKELEEFILYKKERQKLKLRTDDLKIQNYAKALAAEHTKRADKLFAEQQLQQEMEQGEAHRTFEEYKRYCRCEMFLDYCIWQYDVLDLTIHFEDPLYASLDWLLETETAKRPYFEMCGPKIPKRRALKLARIYNNPSDDKECITTVSGYGIEGTGKRNYGLFHLDGRIGLNSTLWLQDQKENPASMHCDMLLFLLALIYADPQLEFAIMVTKWDEVPAQYRTCTSEELPSTWQFDPRPENVSYGVAYDPSKKELNILKPKTAWECVKNYQQQYSKEQRQVFDPIESRRYYETDRKGRRELSQFLERAVPDKVMSEIPMKTYLEKLCSRAKNPNYRSPLWFYEDWMKLYRRMKLNLLFDDPQMMTSQWIEQENEGGLCPKAPNSLYFEMCGPKISKKQAIKMAADYNEPTLRSTLGKMSQYSCETGSGVFRLDGCVGQSGEELKARANYEVLDAIFDMIKAYPKFEFAVLIIKSEKTLERTDGLAVYSQDDVEYGACYDPAQNVLRFLGPREAYLTMKKYQVQYTVEERRLFDPKASENYYRQDSQGRKNLAELMEYQQKICKKK